MLTGRSWGEKRHEVRFGGIREGGVRGIVAGKDIPNGA